MKILIVEDEQLTALKLETLLRELISTIEIVGVLQSVSESIDWFNQNAMPDMVFMDIQLADGLSFSIFDKIDITCPIIFTTAYDEYALKAFEVNSIDYLLKPVSKTAIKRALDKIEKLSTSQHSLEKAQLIQKVADMIMQQGSITYKSSLLVSVKDKLIPLLVKDMAYIYFEDRNSAIINFDGTKNITNFSLDDLMKQLDPSLFFRANRQFIVSRPAIKDITLWFGNRVVINLRVEVPERIIVSRTNVTELKNWITE